MNKVGFAFVWILMLSFFQFAYGNTIKMNNVDWNSVNEIAGSSQNMDEVILKPKNKAVAITLAVTLGAFGVHRLYLGTSNKVPIIYTLTLGGGFGVLMVSDIIAIIATKDINTYSPSEKVFMWAK